MESSNQQLRRPKDHRIIGGVVSAFSKFYGLEISTLRILAVGLCLFYGVGFWAYVIAWAIILSE